MIIECKWCGEEFQYFNRKRKFCADRCRIDYHRANKRERRRSTFKPKDVKCLWCHKVFTKFTNSRIMCGRACAQEYANAKQRAAKPHYVRDCALCGKTYITRKKTQAFCCDAHKDIGLDSSIDPDWKLYHREKCYECLHWDKDPGPHGNKTCLDYLADLDKKTPYCYERGDFSSFELYLGDEISYSLKALDYSDATGSLSMPSKEGMLRHETMLKV